MNKQHPCSHCGKELKSDDMYDLILSCREPRYNRRSRRSTVEKYLPPVRYVVNHIYLCHECGNDMKSFMETYEGGIE